MKRQWLFTWADPQVLVEALSQLLRCYELVLLLWQPERLPVLVLQVLHPAARVRRRRGADLQGELTELAVHAAVVAVLHHCGDGGQAVGQGFLVDFDVFLQGVDVYLRCVDVSKKCVVIELPTSQSVAW